MKRYQVIILGAGVNGAGIARDLALRGVSCALVDKADLCNGTSAWSTRLIHGGLRYLEYAEVDLVRESLREREVLLRNAPHLVRPLPLMIPIYKGARRGPLMVWAGMLAYDILSFDKSLPWHRMMTAGQVRKSTPGLRSQGLRGAAVYYDAQVEYAERLVVENALDARRHGADFYLYHEVVELGAQGVRVCNEAGQVDLLQADLVINVTGPWVDQLLERCTGEFPRQMGGTKGSHIIVDPFPGLPQEALYVEASADGRPYFIVPWNDQILIGTTDLRSDEDLDQVKASRDECQYLIDETNRLYPEAQLSLDKIHFTYSGIRPLPHTPAGKTAAITRRHQVVDHPQAGFPLLSVVGGKLTTFRSLAQEAVDKIFKKLRLPKAPCRTATRPLPGYALLHEPRFTGLFADRHGLSLATSRHLTRTYGAWAEDIAVLANQQAELRELVCARTGAIAAEVVWSCQREEVTHLEDFMLRRSLIGWRPGQGVEAIDPVLRWMAPAKGWDAAKAGAERDRYLQRIERFQVPLS
ncbi:glycerol-3-phosphate dehydrogenase/oxidase [bacterium]|nr:glycerol-3-phosphate dehydrogenase/oxidase [bacterium]